MSLGDVKGYYTALGITPEASAAEVKRAYRARAKEMHPDTGGAGDGTTFRTLTEAYHVLSDAHRRAEYDALCRTLEASARPAAEPKAEAPRAGPARPARARETGYAPVRCRRCATVSAQPRYVRLRKVTGRLTRSQVEVIEGAFCRSCADRVALWASLHTWLLGWWSLPRGPLDTLRALATNLAGGDKPAAPNAALLAHQARAFAARGDAALAAGLALQANEFRYDAALEPLIAAGGGRRLRDRWRIGGLAFVIQALPVGLGLAWLVLWLGRRALSSTIGG